MQGCDVVYHAADVPALIQGGYPVVFSTDVGKEYVLAELKEGIAERYILNESYYSLTELATLMLAALNIDKKPPMVLPISLVLKTGLNQH
jgi:hypothetical protein